MSDKKPMTTTEAAAEFYALAVLVERVSARLSVILREHDHISPHELRKVLSSEVDMLDTIRGRIIEDAHEVTA
jgi:hypothetical protein